MIDAESLYRSEKAKKTRFIQVLAASLVVAFLLSLSLGSVYISPIEVLKSIGHGLFPAWVKSSDEVIVTIVNVVRIPRALLAVLTGAALGISGAVMQSTLRNPLVSPFTLGLSSAASFGAALIIVTGPMIFGAFFNYSVRTGIGPIFVSSIFVVIFAFIFGIMSMLMVLAIGKINNQSRSVVILGGVIIGYLFQAGVTALKYISEDGALREITIWLMGGMWGAAWKSVLPLIPIVLLCGFALCCKAVFFNAISGGDDVAKTLGIDVPKFRRDTLLIATLCTSACIAFTGIIGFIGLMSPHICRMIIGNDQRFLLPASGFMGALIIIVSDTAARMVLAPVELPVGVLMYLIGGAFFIYLISSGHGRRME